MSFRSGTLECHRRAVGGVIAAMRGDPSAQLDLGGMAATAYMSHYHFLRVFERVTHISPARFRAALRIEHAKRMLLETAQPVTTVCFEAGYNSLGTFTRIFTDAVGVNPTAFRKLGEVVAGRSIETFLGRYFERVSAPPRRHMARGWVRAPANFEGLIFVGVFSSRIPQQRPLSGCVLAHPGRFELPLEVSNQGGYLLAAGFPADVEGRSYLLGSREVLVAAAPLMLDQGRPTDLMLRALGPLDPPILIALPMLLVEVLSSNEVSNLGEVAALRNR